MNNNEKKYKPPKSTTVGRNQIWVVEEVNQYNETIREYKFSDFVKAYRWYMERK